LSGGKKKRGLRRSAAKLLVRTMRLAHRRRAILAATVILGLACYAGFHLWSTVKDEVARSPEYALALHQIHITTPPPWIRADVKAEALRDSSLDRGVSILDERLAERLSEAFSFHPWVQRVEKVSVHYPARVEIDLVYRRPAAMIAVSEGLFPVDENGVLLPSGDFTPAQARRYPRIEGMASQPLGPIGTPWGDADVADAVRIAVALRPVWEDLDLYSIRRQTNGGPPPTNGSAEYELVTAQGGVVPWGRAPGKERKDESKLVEKVERLRKLAEKFGRLDGSPAGGQMDLRVPGGRRTAARGAG
jgi:hypothetical protein